MLPDISPNLHPLIIHFPISFLVAAVVVDLVALLVRRWPGMRVAAVFLYAFGALSALAAYLSGEQAEETVDPPASAIPTLNSHADWAERTLIFFAAYAVARLVLWWLAVKKGRALPGWGYGLVFLVGAAGQLLLVQTGLLGGALVYEHGVGVGAVRVEPLAEPEGGADARVDAGQIHFAESGSWHWTPGPGAERVLAERFRFFAGSLASVRATAPSGADSALALHVSGGPVLFVAGDSLRGVQAEAELHVAGFDGRVRLAHHVRAADAYDFLEVAGGRMRQGRVEHGNERIYDDRPLDASGWLALRVVGNGTHFRGYSAGKLVTHGHGTEAAPGATGLYLDGTGTVLLRSLRVEAIP